MVHSDRVVVVLRVTRVLRKWRMRTMCQAATKKLIVVEADIFFEKEENTKEYSKYLKICTSIVHKMSKMTASFLNRVITQL